MSSELLLHDIYDDIDDSDEPTTTGVEPQYVGDIDTFSSDHSPDFVSLLSLISSYFTNTSHFQKDGSTPRTFSTTFSLGFTRRSLLGQGQTFLVTKFHYRGKEYAIKQPRFEDASEKELLRLVLRELRVLTLPTLRAHPNICPLIGYGWSSNTALPLPYLVMEYCERGTLLDFMTRNNHSTVITTVQKKDLILDITTGIQALHKSGIVHCDIRWENILIQPHPDRGYIAKISDFGSALTDVNDARVQSGGGFAASSFPCCAPEAYRFVPLAEFNALDIYPLGIVALFILLDGENPFKVAIQQLQSMQDQELEISCGALLDEEARRYITNEEMDFRQRVVGLKQRGLTKNLMTWLAHQRQFGEVSQQTVVELIDSTLGMDPASRTLQSVIDIISRDLNPRDEPKKDDFSGVVENVPVSPGEPPFKWNSLTMLVDDPNAHVPLSVQQKFMVDLELRAEREPKMHYFTTIATCYLHGFGSGSRTPQKRGLHFLTKEALKFPPNSRLFPWFRLQQYYQAVGEESMPPVCQQITRDESIRLAAVSGSALALQILQREFPEIYSNTLGDLMYELRGTSDAVYIMSREVDDIEKVHEIILSDQAGDQARDESEKDFIKLKTLEIWKIGMQSCGTTQTIIHAAASHNCQYVLRHFLDSDSIDINARNEDGETAILQACRAGHFDVVVALVKKGADVKLGNMYNETCLHFSYAMASPYVDDFVQLMVKNGADIDAICETNTSAALLSFDRGPCPGSALHRAVAMRSSTAVSALLRYGASPLLETMEFAGAPVFSSWTGTSHRWTINPIERACKLAFPEILELLLDACSSAADKTSYENFDGLLLSAITAVDEDAYYGCYLHGSDYQTAVDSTVKALKDRGLDISKALLPISLESMVVSVFAWAVSQNRMALVKSLIPLVPSSTLIKATQFSLVPQRWFKPMHHALAHGNEDMVKLLLQSGVRCEEEELGVDHGVGSMMGAFGTYLGYCVHIPNGAAIARLLIEKGASVDLGDAGIPSPLFQAILSSNFELAEVLISCGADIHRRYDGQNLLWYLLMKADEPTNAQLDFAVNKMGATWDTFMVDTEGKLTALIVLMLVDMQHPIASNTNRRILRFLLRTFPDQEFLDYEARPVPAGDSVSALDFAVALANFDSCELLLQAGAAKAPSLWTAAFKFAVQKMNRPVPVEIRERGLAAVKKYEDERRLIIELLVPAGKNVMVGMPDGSYIMFTGRGTRRDELEDDNEENEET
ncbi:Tankyrase-1 [Arthrobotrys entomopaga]|nr:Tankyrase-1 [Arthrobotrys entomopaga]